MISFHQSQPTTKTIQIMKKLTTLLAALILGLVGITHAADEEST